MLLAVHKYTFSPGPTCFTPLWDGTHATRLTISVLPNSFKFHQDDHQLFVNSRASAVCPTAVFPPQFRRAVGLRPRQVSRPRQHVKTHRCQTQPFGVTRSRLDRYAPDHSNDNHESTMMLLVLMIGAAMAMVEENATEEWGSRSPSGNCHCEQTQVGGIHGHSSASFCDQGCPGGAFCSQARAPPPLLHLSRL